MIILLKAFLFSGVLHASLNPYLVLEAKWTKEPPLTATDIKVNFKSNGLYLESRVPLEWTKNSTFNFVESVKKKDYSIYYLEVPNDDGVLSKNTHVKFIGKKLVVKIPKDLFPIATASKNTKSNVFLAKSKDPDLPMTKIILSMVGLIVIGVGFILLLKRKGNKGQWLASFMGNAKFKKGPLLETISTHSLGPKRQVVVLKAGGEYLLIGCSGDQMNLISRIDEQSVDEENNLLEGEIEKKRTLNV